MATINKKEVNPIALRGEGFYPSLFLTEYRCNCNYCIIYPVPQPQLCYTLFSGEKRRGTGTRNY